MSNDNSTCQHCDRPVHWSSRPADAAFGAFVHDDERTACPTPAVEPITFDQYAAIMATRPSVKPYTVSEWATMAAQHKALLALTYRRELAAL